MGILDDRGKLAGKRAVVVGGADCIGRAVTLALAEAGMDVALCDIKTDELKTTRGDAEALGRQVVAEVADATDPAQLESFYRVVAAAFPSVDVVVNVVGGVFMTRFMDKTPQSCADDIQRNYGYVLDSVRLAVPLIRAGGRGGCIVNFTTIEAHRAAGGFSVYAGAKAATTNFSKALAWELGPEGIRVNIIAPDTTDSPGNHNALPAEMRERSAALPPEWHAEALKMYIPLGTPPTVDDLANAVLFLASDLARSITGQVVHVDGGTAAALGMISWPEDGGVHLPVAPANTMRKLFG